MKNILFLGPPGCGKGTQATLLVEKLRYSKVSTGDLLRDVAKEENERSIRIANILKSGNLVPDCEVNELVQNFFNQNRESAGIIYDGYPRNIDQAIILQDFLKEHSLLVDFVFYFELSQEILVKRITGRYACKDCGAIYNEFFSCTKEQGVCDRCHSSSLFRRPDDSKEVLLERLNIYNELTSPLLNLFKDKVVKVDAEQNVDEINEFIISYLE